MIWLQYLIALISVAIFLTSYFLLAKFKQNFDKFRFLKIASLTLLIVAFVRYMSGDDMIEKTLKLSCVQFDKKFFTFVSLISNWFVYAMGLCLIIYPFFKKDFVKDVIKFFVLPMSALCLVALVPASIGIVGKTNYYSFNFRAILMAFEFAIIFAYSLVVFFEEDGFKTTKKDFFKLFYIVPLMLLAVMPAYMIQGLFGYTSMVVKIKSLAPMHRVIIYIGILLPIFLYFLLKNCDKETCRMVLLYISVGTLLSFSLHHKFDSFASITSWPFHLCNTAMYIVPLCLLFKWDKLFYFTLFINVLGAFLAMAIPNYSSSSNMLSTGIVIFYINHYIAFFMPILIVALGVYQRPKLKQFVYSMVAFAVYFVFILIINAWFSNYATVDYFFVNSDFIADKLGTWAKNLRNITWQFNIKNLTFKFYPLYQSLFFLVYVALGLGMWFIYEWAYQGADTLKDMAARKKKIKLDKFALMSQLNGRSELEPMNLDGVNQLKLINFSKRYGKSNVYAVKDANLTINGGEIFGFLGPNGAGKSTIIKSIVGIQPITDGEIEVCGYSVNKQPVMAKRQIGFVPDHYALYEKLTGREYINYIADLYGVSKKDRDVAIEKYVGLLNMKDAIDNKMNTYSHGMKQKITIISALIHNPKVWILDEPLTGLDPTSIFQVKECMKEHAKAGNIVFFSSHIIDVVEKICDRIAVIKKGHILTCASVADIEKKTTLEDFYLKTIETDVEATTVGETNLHKNELAKAADKKTKDKSTTKKTKVNQKHNLTEINLTTPKENIKQTKQKNKKKK